MTAQNQVLFDHEGGIFPSQTLCRMIKDDIITAGDEIETAQIQPASLDLRLGTTAYRVQASFLSGKDGVVQDKLDLLTMHKIDLADGAVLERGCVYIVPLQESLNLPDNVSATANPKSSTGRLDIFTRLITDYGTEFDTVNAGYKGPLYIEIAPCTFSVLIRTGDRLNQIRFCQQRHRYSDEDLHTLHQTTSLVQSDITDNRIDRGLTFTVDLKGRENGIIGYRARLHTKAIDLRNIDFYDPREFWEPIYSNAEQSIILNPGDFYILASRESVTIPPDQAAEMIAYDNLIGEFRVHYAGFFDPGFGWSESGGKGSRAVLEVRSHDVPFLLDHGQIMGRLVYEKLSQRPDTVYGSGINSNYQQQQLKLGKQFKEWR